MIRLWHLLADLLFPRKCVLCQELLQRGETDICGKCLSETEDFSSPETHTYLHKWTAVWYYEGNVRKSLLHYKFHNKRSYAPAYGRLLAMKILREYPIMQVKKWTTFVLFLNFTGICPKSICI